MLYFQRRAVLAFAAVEHPAAAVEASCRRCSGRGNGDSDGGGLGGCYSSNRIDIPLSLYFSYINCSLCV